MMIKSEPHLQPMEVTISVPGLSKEITIMHITDSHLTEADDREDTLIQQLSRKRTNDFRPQAENKQFTTSDIFSTQIQLCNKAQVDCTVFTGDIIDFPSHLNLDVIKHQFSLLNAPYLYTLGNHDWNFPHKGSSDEERTINYAYFREWSTRVPGGEVLEIGGVRLIAVDNSNYQLTWEQVHFIKEQAMAGSPCFLFMHIPIYLASLEQDVLNRWKAPLMMGAEGWTTEKMIAWGVREMDESTAAFRQWLLQESEHHILGIFCGHVHFAHKDPFGKNRFQYVAKPGYSGGYNIVKLIASRH